MANNLYYINNYLLEKFSTSLKENGFSKVTIKNYLSDVKQFIRFKEQSSSVDNHDAIAMYQDILAKRFKKSSIKRKMSAISRYLVFESKELAKIDNPIKSKRVRSLFYYAPISIGVLLVIILPVMASLYTVNPNNTKGDVIINLIPDKVNTDINRVATIEDTKGLRFVLQKNDNALPMVNSLGTNDTYNILNTKDINSSGTAYIQKGEQQTTIANEILSSNSFVTLSLLSPSYGNTLYIANIGEGYMEIKIENPAKETIEFQWKIDNTEIYHSIR